MRVIVTGGSGFLGSHVADHLAATGHEVIVFDLTISHRHRSVTGDLLDEAAITAALRGAEAVCHLGAIGDVYLAAERPALAAAVNVEGTAHVCEAAIAAGARRIVVASTWEVYGRPRYEPIDEEHPCEPDHPYAITKLAGERMALAYGRMRGLDVIALRLGTSFGTRMRPNSVFRIFVDRALAGQPIVIQGSGRQGRQFTHATDVARAFEAALARGAGDGVFNVVADRVVTIRELAEAVAAAIPTHIGYGEARPGEVPSAIISNARARRELGWSAQVGLEEGLHEIVAEAQAVAATAAGAP